MSFPVNEVRADFPVLQREVNGLPLAYLDSAASAQKPNAVIDAEWRRTPAKGLMVVTLDNRSGEGEAQLIEVEVER